MVVKKFIQTGKVCFHPGFCRSLSRIHHYFSHDFTEWGTRLRKTYQEAVKNRATVNPDHFSPYTLHTPYKPIASDHRLTYIMSTLVGMSRMRVPLSDGDDPQYPSVYGKSTHPEDVKVDDYIRRGWSSCLESFYLLMRLRSSSLNPGDDGYARQMFLFNSNASINNA